MLLLDATSGLAGLAAVKMPVTLASAAAAPAPSTPFVLATLATIGAGPAAPALKGATTGAVVKAADALTSAKQAAAVAQAQIAAQGGSAQAVTDVLVGQVEGLLRDVGLSAADICALMAWLRGDKPACPGARTIDELLDVVSVYADQLPTQLRAIVAARTKKNDCGCGCGGTCAGEPAGGFPWLAAGLLVLAPFVGLLGRRRPRGGA